jgi:hypothetical protein
MARATRKADGASTGGQSQGDQPRAVHRAGPRGARQVGGVREDRPHRDAVTGRRKRRRPVSAISAISASDTPIRVLKRRHGACSRRGVLVLSAQRATKRIFACRGRDMKLPSRATRPFRTAAADDPWGAEQAVVMGEFAILEFVERRLSGGGHVSNLSSECRQG